MRLIGELSKKQHAESFAAFLLTEGISSQVESENGAFEIWIKEEDSVARAIEELNAFKNNPGGSKYQEAIGKAKKIHQEEIARRQRAKKNLVSVSGGKVPKSHPLTICLIAICGIIGLLTEFGSTPSRTKATFRALSFTAVPLDDALAVAAANNGNRDAIALRTINIGKGEVWRLITPIFLHFGVFHLVFNMYWLYLLGGQIENRYGSVWFGILVAMTAAIPNLVQCVVPESIGGATAFAEGNYFIHALGGMSGVNYGLLGYIMIKMSYDRSSNLFVPQSTIVLLMIWLVFCMTPIATEMGMNVANWAHAIGLFVGMAVAYLPVILKGSK